MGLRTSRRVGIKCATALAAVASMTLALGACSLGDETNPAEALVDHFAEALDKQDVGGASSLTSYPNAASATIGQMFDGLKAKSVDYKVSQFIGLDDSSGFFTLDAAWDFGQNRSWSYSAQGSVRKLTTGWRISWDPTVVMPELDHGRSVHMVRTDAPPPRVLDNTGAVTLAEQTINAIKLDPSAMPDPVKSTTELSKAIAPVAPLITSQSLMQDLVVAQGKPITAVSLRDDDFAILEPDIRPIPGVVVEKQPQLITADRRIDSPLVGALRNVWQANRDATAGWAVQMFQPDNAPPTQLVGYQGPPGPDVPSTLDTKLQLAAEDAVVSVAEPATIVAIQPSTGAVLAVAQNSQANDKGPIAFTGLYPAGSNLDAIKAATAIEKGVAPQDVKPEDVMQVASQLGLGVDYKVPGLTETTGRFPQPGKGMEPVRNETPANDGVMVSPFGMALVAASIARGGAAIPMIAFGQPATTEAQLGPLRGDVADKLRALAKDGVGRPEMASVRAYPDVTGLPGSAGDDQWFSGSKGDLAFSVYIQGAEGSDAAAKMSARLFRAMSHPSE
ncbi:NTF2-like N-terminal transpeptidase domain-containing protein [Antrihabitans cavernicola]|uniref:Penicillin-binding protein n=1 Tax=Antrihabitans cavernicola TaxID=2495913 RepID=A0A5A7S692_9NOCA|nr:NTF2-like N-terminal transpeptidase domain-containing protein [Spelaeibacter cavernicola]KAA0019396.1 penicillin-binding protein [Spelaeibacter cavernicola]